MDKNFWSFNGESNQLITISKKNLTGSLLKFAYLMGFLIEFQQINEVMKLRIR